MRYPRAYFALLTCSIISLLPAGFAQAADAGAYLRLDGGVNFAENPSLDVEVLGPGKVKLDPGFRVDMSGGYDINRWVAVEISAGYFYNNAESVRLLDQSRHLDDTWLQGVPLLGGVVLHYENHTDFVPYIGAGVGGVVSTLSLNSDSDTTTAFAYELKAGLIYKLDERAWIDIGYKFLAVDNQEYKIGGLNVDASKTRNHFIGGGVTWRF